MNDRIKISDFVKLTGSTLKTVMYYHKIGLLKEPERSPAGYRLYGSAELSRMQMIKHLKYLGLDLARIKETLGDADNNKTLREVLQALRDELVNEKKSLEERVGKIETLLSGETVSLDEESLTASSFEMISEILGADKTAEYAKNCPELYLQHRKIYGILDDFQWGEDYRGTFRDLAEFFQTHPQQYEISLDLGARLAGLAGLREDDPEIEALARESAGFINGIPQLKEMLSQEPNMKKPAANMYQDLISDVVPPAQIRYGRLFRQYLSKG
jgi:DNA-binding transcriptional MerR regulator